MTWPPPGWYPDHGGGPSLRYWDGRQWTDHVAVRKPSLGKPVSPERFVLIPFAVVFGGLAGVMALTGEWKAAAGVALLAVLVSAPLALFLLVTRRARQARHRRAQRRKYEAGLLARFDRAATDDANQFGAAPPHFDSVDLPDAEQMRQRAWQPDIAGSPAVRPRNPAPWHVVTQHPTQHFEAQDGERPER